MVDDWALGVTAVMLPEIDFREQVELCVSAGVRCYQLRPRDIAAGDRGAPYSNWGNHRFDLTPERLVAEGASLRRRLADAGLEPWGTLPETSFDDPDQRLLVHLRGAAEAGAGRVRLSPPAVPDGPFDYGALLGRATERLAHIVERLARPLGIKVLIETHTRSMAASPGLARALVAGFEPSDVGVIFDVANFSREGEVRPVLAVAALRSWIDCVHVGVSHRVDDGKDGHGFRKVRFESCRLADGDLHVPSWIEALRAAGIRPPLIIEDFSNRAPGPEKVREDAAVLHGILDAADPEQRAGRPRT